MKPIVPHEHGGWALVSVPFLLGMAVGGPTWLHLPLFLAWLFFYLAAYPFRMALARRGNRRDGRRLLRWAFGYWTAGMVFAIPPLVHFPSLLWAGPVLGALLAVNAWYAYRRNERSFVNDVCAILAFSIGGVASYVVGAGTWDAMALWVAGLCVLYFVGSVFFVKTVFRERKNARWLRASKGYHTLLVVALGIVEPLLVLPYAFSAARAFAWGGKAMRPLHVGLIEIAGSVLFLLLSAIVLRVTNLPTL
ncbi:YwiC-like family protein [Calditerricola satsumensis]|uniref:YwiC-like family protein n=1 Tax=Calditerricola satsumensis TaxID=373054 RepID=A0A8J3FAR8_9BACI|nr:YwiC-like family protein [Calditerricola satsumensis]GGJ98300.1 hypothetical protein GCM10007043_10310 [Calditerricola satsumensis]